MSPCSLHASCVRKCFGSALSIYGVECRYGLHYIYNVCHYDAMPAWSETLQQAEQVEQDALVSYCICTFGATIIIEQFDHHHCCHHRTCTHRPARNMLPTVPTLAFVALCCGVPARPPLQLQRFPSVSCDALTTCSQIPFHRTQSKSCKLQL